MYKSIDLFYEPREKALQRITPYEGEPEMTEFESAFLCGLIRQQRPHRILEVGVAAGGTTAIVIECIKQLSLDCEVISVDLMERYYRNTKLRTGFMADDIIDDATPHRFMLGKCLPEVIDEIDGTIDFAILDTAHALPGEILDFLAVYPRLTMGGCVVLHDVSATFRGSKSGYATRLLFQTVIGEKYYQTDETYTYPDFPNIGAFITTDDTTDSIDDVFYILSITWQMYQTELLKKYRRIIEKNYTDAQVSVFDQILKAQDDLVHNRTGRSSFYWRIKAAFRLLLLGY